MPSPINDPALLEEIGSGTGDEELAVIVRLPDPDALPRGVRIVTRFGDIATVRIARTRLLELAESVTAIEAPRNLRPSLASDDEEQDEADDFGEQPLYTRRPAGVRGTGRETIVAALDWGLDFAHRAFRRADGSTRVIALWDQRGDEPAAPDNRWGYGRIYTGADIDRALRSGRPYEALGYHPADAGARGGAHGTHVLAIAAGSDEGGGMSGVAPEADLVFVHLARTTEVLSPGNLGDSASVLEALDFIFSVAGARPCVVNMSVGAHGGPHDGTTLVELGIDQAVSLVPGRAAVNSAGNYRVKRAHTTGRVPAGGEKLVRIEVPPNDPSDSEVELFYGHVDRLTVEVVGPSGAVFARVGPGESLPLLDGERTVGRVHHLTRLGTSGDHHVDVLLYPDPPGGVWALRLIGDRVHDGRYHAWIERDRGFQPTFVRDQAVPASTTGTLGNGRLSITCGCADPHRQPPTLAAFSSGGPTRDGRIKPELVAPGYRIRAARSTPHGEAPAARYVVKSGTSMAAPHVAGTVALMFEAAGISRPLEIYDTRALLFGSADPSPFFNRPRLEPDLHRFGYGYLDIVEAERAARIFGSEQEHDADDNAEEAAMAPSPEFDAETAADDADDAADASVQFSAVDEWSGPTELFGGGEDAPEAADATTGDAGTVEWLPAEGEPAPEPLPPSRRIARSAGATSWIREPDDLRRLAFGALGVAPDAPLRRLTSHAGMLHCEVQPGDLLLRPLPGGAGRYVGVVVSERAECWQDLARRGLPVESPGPGAFVEVLETPIGGGPPRSCGRRLTSVSGRVPRYQQVLRAEPLDRGGGGGGGGAGAASAGEDAREDAGLAETIDIDDVAVEMRGLRCQFLDLHRARRPDGSVRTFSSGALYPVGDWNGTAPTATVDGFPVPKLVLEPAPPVVAGMRRYDVPLAAQRRAVERAAQQLGDWTASPPPAGASRTRWEAERSRLEGVAVRKAQIYSRMWVRQMMYNRFDEPIAYWTRHYNRLLTPATDLDPNVVKSMAYQESRMGTSGRHLMPPPYDWSSGSQHPVRSRFNILQAVDSYGPQQWLMMREMAPAIFTRHGLDALEPRAVWIGMTSREYAAHPTFMQAMREFFEHRSGGANLMGTPGIDLHLDYGFWIRTGIRWLFEKYRRLRPPTWDEAVRAYNGSGADAQAYKRAVLARVGGRDAFAAESVETEREQRALPSLAEESPELDSSAVLSWENLTRIRTPRGDELLYYVITGVPAAKAAAGDEGQAIFNLRVRNTNDVYNHKQVVVKWRLLDLGPNRQINNVVSPWKSFPVEDLEDESSRVMKLSLKRDTLLAAYNSDYQLTRLEVEYHWRESFFTEGETHYNKTGLDFWLMAPIEFLISQRKRVSPSDVPLDKPEHKDAFWIPLIGVHFTPEMHKPVTFQLQLNSQVRQDTTAERTDTKKTGVTKTKTQSTASTFNLSVSAEASQGASAKATIDVLEVGLQELFKVSGSAGYSRTSTDTTSTAVAREFAQSLRLSRSYSVAYATTSTITVTVDPPKVPVPKGTGSGAEQPPVSGYGGVGLYLYPMVAYYEVPYVRYENVNQFGQATSRSSGTVVVPFITGWRLKTQKD